jgi:hypothetical protein
MPMIQNCLVITSSVVWLMAFHVAKKMKYKGLSFNDEKARQLQRPSRVYCAI